MGTGLFLISRLVEFSAAHRLYDPSLSEDSNRALFGDCANPHGHGHNYTLEVTFRGPKDQATGMVVHFARLKGLLQEIVGPLDHRNLNFDVAQLKDTLPTSENIVSMLWDQIASATKGEAYHLYRLRLSSTARNHVEYAGPEEEP